MAFGTERSALTEPSLAWVCVRPPLAVAVAVKSGLIVSMQFLQRDEHSPARKTDRAQI